MNYIGKFISNFKDFYNEINAATLTGAIDVVVVRQEDGSYLSSPFHVRFGKMGVLRSREKVVDIEINGEPVDIHMKLGETGEAFFVEEIQDGSEFNPLLGTSPLPSSMFNGNGEDNTRTDLGSNVDEDIRSQDSGVEAEELVSSAPSEATICDTLTKTVDSKGSLKENVLISDLVNINNKHNGDIVRFFVKKDNRHEIKKDNETQTETALPQEVPAKKVMENSVLSSSDSKVHGNHASVIDLQGSKTDGEEVVKLSKNTRRKRKKRCVGKKQQQQQRIKSSGSHSSESSTTSEVADLTALTLNSSSERSQEVMFNMDEDLDVVESTSGSNSPSTPNLVQSTSMPLLREKSREELAEEWRGGISRSMGPDFHPFSDTDISPPPSPSHSRPSSPIKSDTEYETERTKADFMTDCSAQTDSEEWSWTWGELPTPPPKTPSRKISLISSPESPTKIENVEKPGITKAEDERSMLSGMFSFMRATKKARHNPESEGIYLDDLNFDDLDPEVAALYFPRSFKVPSKHFPTSASKDEDLESGNGPSLPHSPHSVEGAIGGPKHICDLDYDDLRHPIFDFKGFHDIAFSLCGLLHEYYSEMDFPESIFLQSLVTYDDFCENPKILDNPDLVVRMGGKYLNWNTAAPQIMSLVLFQRPVPLTLAEDLAKEHMPKKEIRKRTESKGYSWFSWRRNNPEEKSEGSQNEAQEDNKHIGIVDTKVDFKLISQSAEIKQGSTTPTIDPNVVEMMMAETQTSPPCTPKKDGFGRLRSDSSDSELDEERRKSRKESGDRYKKSLRLSVDQIKQLNLREGSNEVMFSVTTAYQGTTRCKCHIFLWNYDDKIIVSDIDGTITKSDVLGHILPIIGKDWAQSGVAQLFTKIKNNGYHFLYLSARAIGQARITRDYLRSIKQGDLSLPDGPLLLNPTSLVNAFHREVIEKKPEEFKISCLRDIQALFPSDRNPFYAGYGNRINDVWAYRAVGIPISRIFTINHRGELKHELTQTFQSSYHCLSDIANQMFPFVAHEEQLGEFSELQYWKIPMPDVSIEIEAALAKARNKN